MFKKIKEFFVGKPAPAPAPAVETAPYKVPEPAATTPIPFVVTNSNPADNVPVVAEAAPTVGHDLGGSYTVEVAPAVEAVVEAAPAIETPAKKPRKPRAPKAVTTAVKAVKEKAPAKAKAVKTVVKPAARTARSKKV